MDWEEAAEWLPSRRLSVMAAQTKVVPAGYWFVAFGFAESMYRLVVLRCLSRGD
jgi:hypothetical protein